MDLLEPNWGRLLFVHSMSSVGWSCATLGHGVDAVLEEDEASLLAQEEAILKEIQDSSHSVETYIYFDFHR